jgi:hypothetical protein
VNRLLVRVDGVLFLRAQGHLIHPSVSLCSE